MEDYISPSAARRQKEKEQAAQNRRRRRMTFLRTVLMLASMAALLALILSITIPIYRSHNEKKAEIEAEKAAKLEELHELELKYSTLSGMVNYTDNEEYLLRYAREYLGYMLPGDIRIDVDNPSAPVQTPELPLVTAAPLETSTPAPSDELTAAPSVPPTVAPTPDPTEAPSEAPTEEPSEEPTEVPTEEPTEQP